MRSSSSSSTMATLLLLLVSQNCNVVESFISSSSLVSPSVDVRQQPFSSNKRIRSKSRLSHLEFMNIKHHHGHDDATTNKRNHNNERRRRRTHRGGAARHFFKNTETSIDELLSSGSTTTATTSSSNNLFDPSDEMLSIDNEFDPVAFTAMTRSSPSEVTSSATTPYDPVFDPSTAMMTTTSSTTTMTEPPPSPTQTDDSTTTTTTDTTTTTTDIFGRTEQWEPSLDPNPTAKIHDYRPRRIILLRHGESIGNIDEQSYVHTPDWRIPLTDKGRKQANDAGKKLKDLIGNDGKIVFYYSPYERTKATLHEMLSHIDDEQIISYREEPRICEQQFGNFQNYLDVINAKKERHRFGRFFYRFPSGEAGLDVYNRISSFIATLVRDSRQFAHAGCDLNEMNVVIVTHGLSLRLFLMRWFQFSVDQFEHSTNPTNADLVVLNRKGNGTNKWYELDDVDWNKLHIQPPKMMHKNTKTTTTNNNNNNNTKGSPSSLRSILSSSSSSSSSSPTSPSLVPPPETTTIMNNNNNDNNNSNHNNNTEQQQQQQQQPSTNEFPDV